MRKGFLLLLCLLLLVPSAGGAEVESKYAALTFDDGPSGRFTRRLLEGLEERGAKVTFFLCGYRLEQYPDLAAQMVAAGHEIGLHGYSHDNMKAMSRRQIAKELSDTRALLPDCDTNFLRPPGGCCSDAVRQVTEAVDLAIADWSLDPEDWATHDTSAIIRKVLRQVKDGDVILMHDMTDSSVDAALAIVDRLQQEGYQFVTMSELAKIRNVKLKPGQTYRSFPDDTVK